jgi:hypothetical protein
MPDWEREAQRRLENTKFPGADREEVARELAGYLDDLCSESRAGGADESSAIAGAARELHEDPHLGAHLYRVRLEDKMNDRTKRLWLPGMTTLFATVIVGTLVQLLLGSSQLTYFLWFYSLVFIAAAGANGSRRAGSGRMLQAAAGLFPVILFFAAFVGVEVAKREGTLLVLAPSALFLRGVYFFFLLGFNGGVLSLVIIPGAALLLGVLPFLCRWAPRERPAAGANVSTPEQPAEPHHA